MVQLDTTISFFLKEYCISSYKALPQIIPALDISPQAILIKKAKLSNIVRLTTQNNTDESLLRDWEKNEAKFQSLHIEKIILALK